MEYLIAFSMILMAIILILLVLVQRGKGGGLAGALGGSGGQSALGSRAGDTMTRITVGVAAIWMTLCIGSIIVLKNTSEKKEGFDYETNIPVAGADDADATDTAGAADDTTSE